MSVDPELLAVAQDELELEGEVPEELAGLIVAMQAGWAELIPMRMSWSVSGGVPGQWRIAWSAPWVRATTWGASRDETQSRSVTGHRPQAWFRSASETLR
jgi:hypothetical protein